MQFNTSLNVAGKLTDSEVKEFGALVSDYLSNNNGKPYEILMEGVKVMSVLYEYTLALRWGGNRLAQ
jgi:hypothetical protein